MSGLQSATEPSSQVVEPAGSSVRTEPQQTRLAAQSCSSRLWSRTPTWRLCSSWEGGGKVRTAKLPGTVTQPASRPTGRAKNAKNCCETKPENGAHLIHHAGAILRRTANHDLLTLCKVGTCLADFWDTLGTSRVGEWIAGSFCKNSACTLLPSWRARSRPWDGTGSSRRY